MPGPLTDCGFALAESGCVAGQIGTDWAFERYEAVRMRLPAATFPARSLIAPDLGAVADHYDAFVLDAFGVLNIGDTPVPGAVARIAQLRAMGKRLVVLTNAASYPRARALENYRKLGFDFTADEVVSSRDVAASRLEALAPGAIWAALAAPGDRFADIPAQVIDLLDTPGAYQAADGFLLLSQTRWTPQVQRDLAQALALRPRPLVVANPDIVAPRAGGLTVEPGAFAHDLADRFGIKPLWFGKPFPDAFDAVRARLGRIAPARIAMVGDTLHTDVLGGKAAGMGTILVTDHGLFAGRDSAAYIARSGLRPDVIVATT